jgi:hypothetical protein
MKTEEAVLASQTRALLEQACALTRGQGTDWLGRLMSKVVFMPLAQDWLNRPEAIRARGPSSRLCLLRSAAPCQLADAEYRRVPARKGVPSPCGHASDSRPLVNTAANPQSQPEVRPRIRPRMRLRMRVGLRLRIRLGLRLGLRLRLRLGLRPGF